MPFPISPRARLRLVACAASVALAAILATTATATSTPIGALPPGPTAMIHTQPGQLVAVALPHRTGGKVWRVARSVDPKKLRQLSEADVGPSVVLVYKALAVGNATITFGLTKGETAKALESRQFVVMIMPGG
jgi:hypothetical protein